MNYFTVFFFFVLNINLGLTLKCYVCSKSASDPDMTCITNPGGVTTGSPIVNCGATYCTIKRQEYKNPSKVVASFYRGCENNPIHLNTVVEDTDYKTYFRACKTNLCNIGDGIQSVLGNSEGGPENNLLVPDKQGVGISTKNNFYISTLVSGLIILYIIQQLQYEIL